MSARSARDTNIAVPEFSCPVYEAEKISGQPHSCNGLVSRSMADVRRHLVRSRHPDVTFLRHCPTCNEDIVDQKEYDERHGQLCQHPQKQRRGQAAIVEQWQELYLKVYPSATVIPSPFVGKCSFHRRLIINTELSETGRLFDEFTQYRPTQSTKDDNTRLGNHTSIPSNYEESSSKSLLTPYQLICDSDSDKDAGHSLGPSIMGPSIRVEDFSHTTVNHYDSPVHEETPNSYNLLQNPLSPSESTYPSSLDEASRQRDATGSDEQNERARPYPQLGLPLLPPTSQTPETLTCKACGQHFTGKYRRGNLARHARVAHEDDGELRYLCDAERCDKRFKRKDARLKHYRKHHPELAARPPQVRKQGKT